MAIPDYQSLMLPLLRIASDGQEHTLSDAVAQLSEEFGLTPAERSEMLGSGKQRTIANRVGWARTYLAKANLLESSGRGRFRITPRGHETLRNSPESISTKYLSDHFSEFREFRARRNDGDTNEAHRAVNMAIAESHSTATPAELLDATYYELRNAVAEELLARVKTGSPEFFEALVVDLLLAMGYGGSRPDAGKAVGQSGDGGIDGIIKEDRLGLDVVYVQAKRWEGTVGRPDVQKFAGSLEGHRARKGVMMTTSGFSRDAHEYVDRIDKRIVLIDGDRLAQLMIDHGVGVSNVVTYTIKKVDHDYFAEGE